MKKSYIQPEIICCELQSRLMMAVSGPLSNEEAIIVNIDGDLDNEIKIITNVNIWDEEW
ncbi:MAG: hypothetical protein IJS63_06730 [Bacteroidaceae bacterium]|nr:hypothetical protein [Bacteroidaceae bacterium]